MECRVVRTGDPPTDLYHHGTKGMKWGNRLYQNKDGSLTPLGRMRYGSKGDGSGGKGPSKKVSRKVRKQREATLEKARQAKAEKQAKAKSDAETRERLLKSTDAKEIYENRHLLSYTELNERVNRIDLEYRLSSKIVQEHTKTGLDHVNDAMKKSADTLNNATNLFRKVDDAYTTVSKSAVGKALAKKLGLEPPKKDWDWEDFYNNIDKLSTEKVIEGSKRAAAQQVAKKMRDNVVEERRQKQEADEAVKKLKEAQKQVDNYNKSGAKDDYVGPTPSSTYSKKGDDISDNKTATGKGNPNRLRLDYIERFESDGKDIIGEGTSKFTGWDEPPTRDAVYDGQRYVKQLLTIEDKSGR